MTRCRPLGPSLAGRARGLLVPGAWNQYLWPLVSTGGTTPLDTVQIGLKQLLGTQVTQIPVSLAGAVIAFVPLLILLVVFQKQLVRSLTAGAVKYGAEYQGLGGGVGSGDAPSGRQ